MNITVNELLKCMLDLFNNTSDNLHKEYEKLSQKDMELSDLDHYTENHRLKAYEHSKINKLRQEIRFERRDIKNNIEMIELIKKFTDKYNSKLITGDIIQILKEQGKLEDKQQNPKYKYRTDVLKRLEAKDEY